MVKCCSTTRLTAGAVLSSITGQFKPAKQQERKNFRKWQNFRKKIASWREVVNMNVTSAGHRDRQVLQEERDRSRGIVQHLGSCLFVCETERSCNTLIDLNKSEEKRPPLAVEYKCNYVNNKGFCKFLSQCRYCIDILGLFCKLKLSTMLKMSEDILKLL